MKSFQNTVDISQERYKAGDISEDDYLKIKLQLLQFQSDAAQAELARLQALSDLRQLLGYESVSADYDVAETFDYQPIRANLEDLQAKALSTRPDLRAAQQGVTAANSQYELARANGKRDVDADIDREIVLDSIYGPMWYRLLIGHGPLDTDYAARLAAHLAVALLAQRSPATD